MNKQTILSSILSVALLSLTACNNDNNRTSENEINATQSIEFKVDFADYNSEQEMNVTRTTPKEVKFEQRMIDLGNGVLAQCTLLRDTTKQTKSASTRALTNDTYTMLAYDAATHAYKGNITGTVTGGVFTSTSANQDIALTPGTYDFVLYNSKVTRSGNNLTVNRADADAGLIGRTQQVITATPHKQKVSFTMKHVGAKVKIKLTGYMDFPAVTATLASVNATDVPNSSIYDASTGTWTAGAGTTMSTNTTFNASTELKYYSVTYTSTSNEETMFMPATDVSKLKLTFNSGNIYLLNMANASLTFSPASTLKLEQNGAYVLNVKLMYRFLYLMSDGTTGFINETTYGGGTKTPIAVVLSRSNRIAVALKDVPGGGYWASGSFGNFNTHQTTTDDALNAGATSGRDETWDASYSTGTIGVKATNSSFPAFKSAAEYDPGVTYTGTPALQWYLPSFSDFKWLLTLGFGDKTAVTQAHRPYSWYGNLANVAFTQVGGTGLIFVTGAYTGVYWSSTEINSVYAVPMKIWQAYMGFYVGYMGDGNKLYHRYNIRSFVAY
jgi:hypothetical protein